MMVRRRGITGGIAFALAAMTILAARSLPGQCPEEPPLANYTGGGTVTCPCFVAGEEAGGVFEAPAAQYPIEILRVDFGWGSVSGGAPDSLEGAIKIYAGDLPDPGTAIFTLPGPVLSDGFINEFDLEPLPGDKIIDSGPFTVTLQFANDSTLFGPSLVDDGNGCQSGANVVYAIPGGWNDACALGVTGDWVVSVVYRQVSCGPAQPDFVRGDTNLDGSIDIADAIYNLAYQFSMGPSLCLDAQDVNDDGEVNIADAVTGLAYLFSMGSPPPPPFPGCGPDPTPDAGADLGCATAPAGCP